jgi:pimeloyl-ACP methyl ester carboxylesterase
MRVAIETIAAYGEAERSLRVLIIEPQAQTSDTPVLLFLHGKGEASSYENELPFILVHLSPPFRAIMGELRDVTVVAPQAPYNLKKDEDGWNWRGHVKQICKFLTSRFEKRKLLATGFSRGGLGVLQLLQDSPKLISKWAIVDPQRASNDEEEKRLLAVLTPDVPGWIRYGEGIPKNKPFSDRLAEHKKVVRAHFLKEMTHGDLALAAYNGDKLRGAENLYDFLGLKYRLEP